MHFPSPEIVLEPSKVRQTFHLSIKLQTGANKAQAYHNTTSTVPRMCSFIPAGGKRGPRMAKVRLVMVAGWTRATPPSLQGRPLREGRPTPSARTRSWAGYGRWGKIGHHYTRKGAVLDFSRLTLRETESDGGTCRGGIINMGHSCLHGHAIVTGGSCWNPAFRGTDRGCQAHTNRRRARSGRL